MKYKRRQRPPKKGAPAWMVTYSDLVTLILVFFVLLFGMSQIDIEKFEALAQSFRNRAIFDFYPSAIPYEETPNHIIDEGDLGEGFDFSGLDGDQSKSEKAKMDEQLKTLLTEVSQFVEESGLDDIVIITRNERGVVLVLPEQVLFETGQADIIDEAMPFLDHVGSLIKDIPNVVRVEGHTDNRPISTARYPSNWELSSARAASVIRYFIEEHDVDPTRFIATGYSDTRPIAPNDGPENWAKNRRVEIVILDPYYVGEDGEDNMTN